MSNTQIIFWLILFFSQMALIFWMHLAQVKQQMSTFRSKTRRFDLPVSLMTLYYMSDLFLLNHRKRRQRTRQWLGLSFEMFSFQTLWQRNRWPHPLRMVELEVVSACVHALEILDLYTVTGVCTWSRITITKMLFHFRWLQYFGRLWQW